MSKPGGGVAGEDLGAGVTLYQGDCLEILPALADGSVDAVVTSPPYNLAKQYSGTYHPTTPSIANLNDKYARWYADEMPEPEYQSWQKSVIRECLRVCAGSVFYNHRPRFAWHGRNAHRVPSNVYHPMDWLGEFPLWCEIVWDRCGTGPPNAGRYPTGHEFVYQLGRPKVWKQRSGYYSVWRIPPERDVGGHVCPFPVELVRRCIIPCTDSGDVVLDPFAGSGTTGVAAVLEGRRCILIEKEPAYCDIIRSRVAEASGAGPNSLFRQPTLTGEVPS